MAMHKKKVLVVVEGEKTDYRLMEQLFQIYQLDSEYEIIPFRTNIYVLYNAMFRNNSPEDMDLAQTLKEREEDPERRKVLDDQYTDILLVFDMDPQDSQYSPEHLSTMQAYFSESTEMGKLYLSYPMIEAFYHLVSLPDPAFHERLVAMSELRGRHYKQRVSRETIGSDYRKFAHSKDEWSQAINHHIAKAKHICLSDDRFPDMNELLSRQIDELENHSRLFVLCTCVFFILEYNSDLLQNGND